MLLTRPVFEGIARGEISLVFRRWKKPTVKPGGRLRNSMGELAIDAVDVVDPATISDSEAKAAGFLSADDLRADLFKDRKVSARGAKPDEQSEIYRVTVRYVGEDARSALRSNTDISTDDFSKIQNRLTKADQSSAFGPWTIRVLERIEAWPGRRAPELAELEGRETLSFKTDVRKLKELGLTESLAIGYRLSPRGEAFLNLLRSKP